MWESCELWSSNVVVACPTWTRRKRIQWGADKRHVVASPRHHFRTGNCCFSLDVNKIQTTELSMLPRFYNHDVLEQLKTNFHTNFPFKRVLGFVIEYAWISKLLRDAAFTWRPRELSCRLKNDLFQEICYLNSSCIRKSITLMFMSFWKNKFTLL